MRFFPLFFVLCWAEREEEKSPGEKSLLVVTVATDETDGFLRWEDSVKRHNLDYMVLFYSSFFFVFFNMFFPIIKIKREQIFIVKKKKNNSI